MSDDRHASETLRCQGSYPTERYEPIALKAIFFGLLFFWASKRKVTRAAAADRNARCVSGPTAAAPQKRDQTLTRQPNTEALDSGLRRNDEPRPVPPAFAPPGMTIWTRHPCPSLIAG